jgi:hypothetical protein
VKVQLPFEPEQVVQTVQAAMEQRDPTGDLWRQVLAAFVAHPGAQPPASAATVAAVDRLGEFVAAMAKPAQPVIPASA